MPSVELPPATLQSGDVITIKTELTVNNPRDDVWPAIEAMELVSVDIDRAEPSRGG